MNCRPAGYSSDEDEDDEFGEFTFSGETQSLKEQKKEFSKEHNKQLQDLQQTPENKIYDAIISGNIELLNEELDNGLDVNSKICNDYTLLFFAASQANLEIIKELLRRGADPNYKRDGSTMLMAVCQCSKNLTTSEQVIEIIKIFIECRVDVKVVDRKRRTAIMFACAQGFVDVVSLLIPFSRLDGEDNQGWTALFYAVDANNPEIVKLLIDNGANVEHKDIRGHDIKHYAQMGDFSDVIKYLPTTETEIVPDDLLDTGTFLEDLCGKLGKKERPHFINEVSLILYGMQCETLIPLFEEKKISLVEFLCLDNEQLVDLGVKMTFQRDRILRGLSKFHKYAFKNKSMPAISPEEDYCSYDILITVASCIKHLTVMEAHLKYLRKNVNIDKMPDEMKKAVIKSSDNIKDRTKKLAYITKVLNKLSVEIDAIIPHQPDLITKNSKFSKYSFKWSACKWFTIIGATTISMIYICQK